MYYNDDIKGFQDLELRDKKIIVVKKSMQIIPILSHPPCMIYVVCIAEINIKVKR